MQEKSNIFTILTSSGAAVVVVVLGLGTTWRAWRSSGVSGCGGAERGEGWLWAWTSAEGKADGAEDAGSNPDSRLSSGWTPAWTYRLLSRTFFGYSGDPVDREPPDPA
ncbi:hypothetical protein B0T45_19440 [Chromobacterium haemolyticum]|uniref:Uncharacterized protein n=1 Tax=Chromobacterium haemolyticum TaxID=394935 RepID=A0A1W0CHB1_9NEIS|nr:hypothetical protein B0T45_19440 [Chromobacterium haemolyticum]